MGFLSHSSCKLAEETHWHRGGQHLISWGGLSSPSVMWSCVTRQVCVNEHYERRYDWQFSIVKTHTLAQTWLTSTAPLIGFFFRRIGHGLVKWLNAAASWQVVTSQRRESRGREMKNKIPLYYPAVGCLWQGLGPDYARVLCVSSVAYCISTNRITQTGIQQEQNGTQSDTNWGRYTSLLL